MSKNPKLDWKPGQKVLITKPTTNKNPCWIDDMDKFDGKIEVIDKVYDSGNSAIGGYSFDKEWLTPLIESNGRYFRKATKEDIGKACYFTDITCLEDLQNSLMNREAATLGSFDSRGQAVKLIQQSAWTHAFVEVFDKKEDLTDSQVGAKINTMTGWGVTKFADRCIMATDIGQCKPKLTPAEKSAKPKEESKMALIALASKTVRNAAWSVVDWALITPTKNTLRPVGKVVQYSTAYAIIGLVVYSGWSLYQNPSWVFEKVTELSPIEIRFKGDPANEEVPTSVEAKSE